MRTGKNERIEELENELVAIRTWEKVQIEITKATSETRYVNRGGEYGI